MKHRLVIFAALFFAIQLFYSQTKKTQSTKGSEKVTQQENHFKKGDVVLETSKGVIVIELNDSAAPQHSANFRKLANDGFYDSTTFHRVIPGFMIQGGDPNSKDDDRSNDGMGGPGYKIPAEIGLPHVRGVIAAARQGDPVNPQRMSNGSQFYITVADAHFLDGQYSVFGKVAEGMDVVDKIVAVPRDARDNPLEKVLILKTYVVK